MNIESITVVIVADGRSLVIQPTPAQISDIAWQCVNGVREVPSDGPWIKRELSGMATFTLHIEGERAAVNGTWVDAEDAPVVISRETLKALFDLAVNSLDFGSGFWDREDTISARTVAVALGIDPMEATPYESERTLYAHPDGAWHAPAHCLECGASSR